MNTELPDQYTIHETEEDRERQKQTLRMFARRFNLKGKLTSTLDKVDAQLFKEGQFFAVAEAKFRNTSIDKYPDYTVDVDKVENLVVRASTENIDAYLVVSWNGDVRYLNLSHMKTLTPEDDCRWPVTMQKRRDRKEKADPVYHIPIELFEKVTSTQE